MKRQRVSAARWLACGTAGDYIQQADIQPGDKLVLVCRVSGIEQKRRQNPEDQVTDLRQQVEQRGGIVVGSVPIQVSGFDPYWLWKAVLIAKQHGASLLAETTDRYVRHPAYHSEENWTRQARESDLQELVRCADGVQLLTMASPDAPPEEVRGYQSSRGQRRKNAKGGRPETPDHVRLRRAVLKKLNSLPR